MTRLTINLLEDERMALIKLSEEQRRPPAEQAAWLIRQQLAFLNALIPQSMICMEEGREDD